MECLNDGKVFPSSAFAELLLCCGVPYHFCRNPATYTYMLYLASVMCMCCVVISTSSSDSASM